MKNTHLSRASRDCPHPRPVRQEGPNLRDRAEAQLLPINMKNKPWAYLTGQAIATYIEVRLIPQVFGRLASGHFCSA